MGCGRFLQSRSQADKNRGVVFHFQAPGPGLRLEMKIWGGLGEEISDLVRAECGRAGSEGRDRVPEVCTLAS
jgi:hypothetical protein